MGFRVGYIPPCNPNSMGTGLFLSGPGSCGPVLVARSRWPGPGGRSQWPGPGGLVVGPPAAPFFCCGPYRSRSRSRPRSLPSACPWSGFGGPVARPGPGSRFALLAVPLSQSLPLPVPGGRAAVPIKRITYAVWPASMSPGMDAQSLPRIWLFYAVLQTTGERQTILRSRNHYRTKTGAKRLPKPTA